MSILITGIDGFIGKKLSNELIKRNYVLVPNYGDISKDQAKEVIRRGIFDINSHEFFREYHDSKIDFIVHLAAKTSIEDSIKSPYKTYSTNVAGTLNLLEFARKKDIKYFIFASTYLYGKPKYLPIDENHPLKPHSPYNKSKQLAEMLCENYSMDYGLNIVSLRPFYVYGPNNKERSFIETIISQISNNEQVVLNGLNTRRDFLYIDDFVNLIIKILANFPNKYNVYNVGYGTSHTLTYVTKKTAKLMNKEIRIKSKRVTRSDITNIVADISKVSKKFKWKPNIDLDLGLKLIVEKRLK